MSIHVQRIEWGSRFSLDELIANAKSERADYLIVQLGPNPEVMLTASLSTSSTDLIVFRDSIATERWSRLSHCLPTSLYFLAALPSAHSGVAIAVKALETNAKLIADSLSLCEMVARLSASATTSFVDNMTLDFSSTLQCPPLTTANIRHRNPWLRDIIHQLPGANNRSSSTEISALKAGLFLLNDFADESHECSQSIEGLGPLHTGDYWHAILHRREPDYGNSKYWFRHVGRHPVYVELAATVSRRLNDAHGALAAKLQRWKTRLVANDSWDPFSFVDLCEAAASDDELRTWCEQVQYDEMLLLLESTARDAIH